MVTHEVCPHCSSPLDVSVLPYHESVPSDFVSYFCKVCNKTYTKFDFRKFVQSPEVYKTLNGKIVVWKAILSIHDYRFYTQPFDQIQPLNVFSTSSTSTMFSGWLVISFQWKELYYIYLSEPKRKDSKFLYPKDHSSIIPKDGE